MIISRLYDDVTTLLVVPPFGFGVIGLLLSRGFDARWLIAAGMIIMSLGNYWMSQMNLEISAWHVVWPRVVVIAGLSMIFAPLRVAAFLCIPPRLRGAAVGLLALLRNEGGSVGTSIAKTIHGRRDQFQSLRFGENLDPLNPAVNSFLDQAQSSFLQLTGDPVTARRWRLALQSLEQLRQQQSSALALLVLLIKRSVVAKGAHAAAE